MSNASPVIDTISSAQSTVSSHRLSWFWRLLAAVMRCLPTEVRRIDMFWHALYRRIGGGPYYEVKDLDRQWPAGLQPGIRGKHGQLMFLNLQDWSDRRAYFSGRFYQQDIDRLLRELLRPGDQYVDVGANIGMTMLTAAGRIGPEGRGILFEPNPAALGRLRTHVEKNRLTNFELVNAALSNSAGTSRLFLEGAHSGLGSLSRRTGAGDSFVEIRTVLGNDFAPRLEPSKPTVIKIDVEGHEVPALSGMSTILSLPEVVVVAEVCDKMLRQAGHSRELLHRHMSGLGFEAFRVELVSQRWRKQLELFATSGTEEIAKYDAVFVRRDSRIFERVAPFVRTHYVSACLASSGI